MTENTANTQVPDDVTPVEEAEPEAKQEVEPEGAAETSLEESELKEEAVESGNTMEGDVPAEEVRSALRSP